MNKQLEWEIIKKLFTSLQDTTRLYTGQKLKELLYTQVFNLRRGFDNLPINSGRWAAYCHYQSHVAFANLLDKHNIDRNSIVVVHPMLPSSCVDEIIRRGCSLIVTDISSSTLSIESHELESALQSNPDLIIQYSKNGLYSEISDIVSITNDLRIPSLVFIDNELPTTELLELFEKVEFGSVIWNFGDSFLDDQLNVVLPSPLSNNKWYVSWYIENRARSSLEYHLSTSKDSIIPMLENYLYLLLVDYQKHGVKEKVYPQLYKFLAKENITDPDSAREALQTSFQDIQYAAIPDIIFDIELMSPTGMRPNSMRDIEDLEFYIQSKNQEFYSHTIEKEGITTPFFDQNRVFLDGLVFTSSKSAWSRYLETKGFPMNEITLHPNVSGLKHKNLVLLEHQGLKVDFKSIMYKSI